MGFRGSSLEDLVAPYLSHIGLEEGPVDSTRREKSRCWVVDPIDGTTHFARGDLDWAIMMALLVDEKPVVGVV